MKVLFVYLAIFIGCYFQLYIGYISKVIRKHKVDKGKNAMFIFTTLLNALIISLLVSFIGLNNFNIIVGEGVMYIKSLSVAFVYGMSLNSLFKEIWKLFYKR